MYSTTEISLTIFLLRIFYWRIKFHILVPIAILEKLVRCQRKLGALEHQGDSAWSIFYKIKCATAHPTREIILLKGGFGNLKLKAACIILDQASQMNMKHETEELITKLQHGGKKGIQCTSKSQCWEPKTVSFSFICHWIMMIKCLFP